MKLTPIVKSPFFSLTCNFVFAVGNFTVGFVQYSWWFITVGAFYTVLAVMRFLVLLVYPKAGDDPDTECFVKRMTGILLLVLSFCLIGVNTLSVVTEQGTKYHEIIMIAIATYAFAKITVSIIGLIKTRQVFSPITTTLRNISFSDAVVSIYTLQRSMLVSFSGMDRDEIRLFNILTGTVVWIIVLFLGINLIGGKGVEMAKLKIVETNKKIAEAVTGGYKKIEKGVVDGYKKIEKGVVDGYTKVEDKFVEAYLVKDGESVTDAKERLKNQYK